MSLSAIFASQPAVGAIGGAINSIMDAKGARSMGRQAVAQTREQIAFEEAIRQRQAELLAQEQARQQIYARGAGDAFGDSLGGFQGFEQQVGDASSQIADLYRQFLNQKTAQQQMIQAIAPMVSGPAADREASERSKASEEVSGDAGRLAEVLGFAEAMQGAGRNMQGNEQLAAILNNFARGSANAGQAEIDSQAGRFQSRDIMRPAPSMLGDMFVGLAGLYGNRNPVDYSLVPEGNGGQGLRPPVSPSLDYMGGGQGVRMGPSGSTGLVMKSNLGIR
jgi:hypothetical protein